MNLPFYSFQDSFTTFSTNSHPAELSKTPQLYAQGYQIHSTKPHQISGYENLHATLHHAALCNVWTESWNAKAQGVYTAKHHRPPFSTQLCDITNNYQSGILWCLVVLYPSDVREFGRLNFQFTVKIKWYKL